MEGFVCLEKQEKLALYIEGGKLNDLVLKDVNPFPGYYSETPGVSNINKPKYIFIALKQGEGCYEDTVLRAMFNLKKFVDFDFEANYGRLSVLNKHLPCIRLKLNDLSKVTYLLDKFKAEGIKFEKTFSLKPYESIIKIRKYIIFNEFSEYVYTGAQKNHYYLEVPVKLEWNDFVKMILSIRGDGEFSSFDAAQISFYKKNGIKEFIRIYTKSFSKENFKLFRNRVLSYLEKIQ